MQSYKLQYTKRWFDGVKPIWKKILLQEKPKKILEIGSYEGQSICYMIETLSPIQEIEIHCIDNWKGGSEHQKGASAESDMRSVKERFFKNVQAIQQWSKNKPRIRIHENYSEDALIKINSVAKNYFDLVYIDGSHRAEDVLKDAILSFRLLKKHGILIFDDYLWTHSDILQAPKISIDAFTTIFSSRLEILKAPPPQIYIRKIG